MYIQYICIYIKLRKITGAQALFQYLIWSYIRSRMHEDCILFDRFELWHASQQQYCSITLSPPDSLGRGSNFQAKPSRSFETSWDLESAAVDNGKKFQVCRCLCCYASESLKWCWQKLNRPAITWTAKRNAYVNYLTIHWNCNVWQETLVVIFTKCDWLKRMPFVWDHHGLCCMLRDWKDHPALFETIAAGDVYSAIDGTWFLFRQNSK